jgi:hypothetical protein
MSMANLTNWEANAGYGVDALGRPSYQNQFSMGAGPRDHLAQAAIHNDLKARAAADDPQGMLIRELLEQFKRQNLPGNVRLPVFPVAGSGNMTYSYQEHNGRG